MFEFAPEDLYLRLNLMNSNYTKKIEFEFIWKNSRFTVSKFLLLFDIRWIFCSVISPESSRNCRLILFDTLSPWQFPKSWFVQTEDIDWTVSSWLRTNFSLSITFVYYSSKILSTLARSVCDPVKFNVISAEAPSMLAYVPVSRVAVQTSVTTRDLGLHYRNDQVSTQIHEQLLHETFRLSDFSKTPKSRYSFKKNFDQIIWKVSRIISNRDLIEITFLIDLC